MNFNGNSNGLQLQPGSSTILSSSANFSWNGFLVLRQAVATEGRIGELAERDTLSMICSPLVRGEYIKGNGRFVPVSKTFGQLSVVPRGPAPPMRLLETAEIAFCSFESTFIDRVADERGGGRRAVAFEFRTGVRDESLSRLMQLLTSEVGSGNPTGRIYAESLAEALALRFLHLASTSALGPGSKVSKLPRPRLDRVKELVEAHLIQDLTLEALAREAGYSRAHFLRMFRESTGITPHQYVIQRLIARAELLLLQDHLSVAEIATAVGFSSQAHLTLAFRRLNGRTPAEFRRSSRWSVRA
jgi:AraC family transcriptional regulator